MDMNLSGNTILITGGSSGIGFEFAKQLSQMGNTVIITGRNKDKLSKAKQMIPELHVIPSDVSSPAEINALFKKVTAEHPKLNVLINNAGIMRQINLHSSSSEGESITQEIETNLNGPILMVQAFLEHLKTQPAGAIVNVTSGLAFVPLPTAPVYCSTKAALHSFTLSLRAQLKKTKVKVFEVAPPATATDMMNGHDPKDMEGITIMNCDEMVKVSLKAMKADCLEIRPGQANQLKLMNRIAPEFILKQLSKPVERMLTHS
jgi:uncharacterized oxidoreductase